MLAGGRLQSDKLAAEQAELTARIADLDDLISSRERLLRVVEVRGGGGCHGVVELAWCRLNLI